MAETQTVRAIETLNALRNPLGYNDLVQIRGVKCQVKQNGNNEWVLVIAGTWRMFPGYRPTRLQVDLIRQVVDLDNTEAAKK